MVRMGRRRGVSKGKRGRGKGKGESQSPEMLEWKRGKEGRLDTDEGAQQRKWGGGEGGGEEVVRGWYSRILSTCSEARKREGWRTGRFGN